MAGDRLWVVAPANLNEFCVWIACSKAVLARIPNLVSDRISLEIWRCYGPYKRRPSPVTFVFISVPLILSTRAIRVGGRQIANRPQLCDPCHGDVLVPESHSFDIS